MRYLFALLLLLLCNVAHTRPDTTYFDSRGRKIYYAKNAELLQVKEQIDHQKYTLKEFYYSSGIINMSGVFTSTGNGVVTFYDLDGKKNTEGTVVDGKKEGEWKTYRAAQPEKAWIISNYVHDLLDGSQKSYYPGGALKREELYSAGTLVSGKRYDEKGGELTYTPFEVESMPTFDVKSYLATFVVYPHECRIRRISGNVLVDFVVDGAGKVGRVRVVEQVHPLMDAESIRLISAMKLWKPAMKDDEPIPTKLTLPVNFSL